jgi:MFS family permease
MQETESESASGWPELLLTLAIQAFASMAILAIPVIAPALSPMLEIPPLFVGFYIGIVYGGAIVGSLLAGTGVQMLGAIRLSQTGLALNAAGLVLSCTGSVPTMILGAFLLGLGYGPITPASSHLLSQSTPAHRMSLVFSLKQTGVPLGGMLAGALVPLLMTLVGWRFSLLFVALCCVACIAIAQALRGRLDSRSARATSFNLNQLFQPVLLIARQPKLRTLATCSFFFSAVQLCLTTYTVIYLNSELRFGLVAAGFALAVCQFAGIIGRLIWGHISDLGLGPFRTLAVLAIVIALCCIATACLQFTTPKAIVLALLVVFGGSAIGWNGVFLAEVARQAPPGAASAATGGASAITFLGVVVGPPIFALLALPTNSYRISYVALVLPMIWCAVRIWRSRNNVECRNS